MERVAWCGSPYPQQQARSKKLFLLLPYQRLKMSVCKKQEARITENQPESARQAPGEAWRVLAEAATVRRRP
eukprot:scaffold54883_cov31-Tisochrysis_lutea.AAC.3